MDSYGRRMTLMPQDHLVWRIQEESPHYEAQTNAMVSVTNASTTPGSQGTRSQASLESLLQDARTIERPRA